MVRLLQNAYQGLFLARPKNALTLLLLLLAFFSYHAKDFKLDASADSLLLENDKDLQLFREVSARYDTRDFLVVTFTPPEDLFSDESLSLLQRIRDDLRSLEGVDSVRSILDVPLIKSSDVPLLQMAENIQTLETPTIDRTRARNELVNSPVYRNQLISPDMQTSALLINLEEDQRLSALQKTRNELFIRRGSVGLSNADKRELKAVSAAYREVREQFNEGRHREIERVRAVISEYRGDARLHLGGVPMVADDMISFVKSDLITFGMGVFVFLIVVLTVIFRQMRWVVLPLLSCFYAGMTMIGILGLIGWDVTVISSNFLSLMLIITISMNIHLAVRYRQLHNDLPEASHLELVSLTLRRMVWPCLYTALTTIIGFGSLVFSGIKPVQDFGWMMSAGLAVAFLTSFSLFPSALMLLGRPRSGVRQVKDLRVTSRLASLTERHGNVVLAGAVVLLIISGIGISRLTVENSFINYFRTDTEIYQGMKLIDEKLGGTTTLEVLLNLDGAPEEEDVAELEDEEEDFEDWDIDVAAAPAYWFTPLRIDRIKQVHDYLDGLPEVGKVLSLASIIRVAEDLNDGKELDSLELSLLYQRLPEEVKRPLVDPYFSFEHNEARILLRILDSKEDLRRKELLERIRADLHNRLELAEDDIRLTGILVLQNNMLQSLYSSQISTLGAVTVGIAIMFLLLFLSARLAVIGIVPNLLAATTVLGLMGLAGIPLDMMTITIAAITIGIAVDNAIHYIYRFREELPQQPGYVETLYVCHSNIGRAVLYTSATIIFGFSILMLSNFLPTIYFGALTGIAMFIALMASLTLLPRLLLLWRPFA